jgi:hypothetical protein
MRFPYRQQWLLRRMNCRLSRSDPHLAAMLAIFTKLTAGETITSQEQSRSRGADAWRGLVWLGRATVRVAVALIVCVGRMLRRAADGYASARRRLSAMARVVLGISSAARPPLRPSGPGLPAKAPPTCRYAYRRTSDNRGYLRRAALRQEPDGLRR